MNYLDEQPSWEENIPQLETTTPVLGGQNGPDNWQAKALANRTQFLKSSIEGLQSGANPYANEAAAQKAIDDGLIPLNAVVTVRGNTAELWLLEYQNVNSVLTPVLDEFGNQRSAPATAYVNQVRDIANSAEGTATAVDKRTQGFASTNNAKNLIELVTKKGKDLGHCDANATWHFPGGIKISSMDILKLLLGADSIVQREFDANLFSLLVGGRRALSLRNDNYGTVEYHGIPLSNIRGQLPNDVAYAGDSISAFTEATTGAYNSVTRDLAPLVCAQGWPIWAMHASQGLVKFSGVYATGGYTSGDLLRVHIPRVVEAKPTLCVVHIGRNDVFKRESLETTLGNLKRIFVTLRRAGVIPVLCTMSAHSGNDTEQKLMESSINNYYVSYAQKFGLPLIDLHSATTDPQTGEWFNGFNYDASHPRAVGAQAMGKRVADTLKDWVAPTYPRIAVQQSDPATHPNQMPNPLFYDNDGQNPAGWTVITPGTATIATDPAVKGHVWTLNTGADRSITLPVVSGASYGFGFMYKTTSANNCEVYVVAGNDRAATSGYLAGLKNWQGETDSFGVFYDEFTVPAGVTSITVCVRSDDAGLSLGQMSLPTLVEV